jgi:LmbE family N-acetylglucosaminyl deacetylase
MRALDISKYKLALFFTAHPDDLEGFAGGLVKRLSKKADVISIIFSEGNRGRWKFKYIFMNKRHFERLRLSESIKAKKVLGITEVKDLGFEDRKIPVNKFVEAQVIELLKTLKPDLVVSFEYSKFLNFYLHPDHMAVAENVKRVIFENKFKWKFDYLVFNTLLPNCYIDISHVEQIKRRALKFHKTQNRLNRELFFFLDLLPTRMMGFLYGKKYAETYRRVKINTWNKWL